MLSSIFTFLAGIFIVLIWRAFSFLCCRNKDPSEYQKQQEKDKLLAQQGQAQSVGQPKPKNLMEGNFVTEAKDWAGELISGQTTTGRILVSGWGCFKEVCFTAFPPAQGTATQPAFSGCMALSSALSVFSATGLLRGRGMFN